MNARPARFAGSFYTNEPIPLNRQVRLLIQGGTVGRQLTPARPVAIVSPHAGYRFSGKVAGQAFAAAQFHDYARIVILSPSHRYGFDGLAMPSQNRMEVPNGAVRVDSLMRNALLDAKLIRIEDAAHDNEHGVELQIPFLARYFRDVPVLPIVIGKCSVAEVARLVDHLAGDGKPTLFILSSDLSHFHNQEKAKVLDLETAQMIETADVVNLDSVHACGWMPLAGFLASNHGAGARAVRLAMADSADATGDTTRVVGYGAWALYAAGDHVFGDKYRDELLRTTRRGVTSFLQRGKTPTINTHTFSTPLQSVMASFVTLTAKGRLRGCIGSLAPRQPLIEDVIENGIKAAVKDSRFKPVASVEELESLTLKIAVLTKPAPMPITGRDDLERRIVPGVSGLILQDQGRRGTFLPMVWDGLPTPSEFIDGLIRKAGLPDGHWSDSVKIWHYQAEGFAEESG